MRDRCLTEMGFRPLGAQLSESRISRRVFMGAGLVAPVSMLLSGRALGTPGDATDLQFLEDDHGLSIVWRRPDPAFKPEDDKYLINLWRLSARAFGPNTEFTLRTLQAGKQRGYELRVSGVRFGPWQRQHLFVFLRSGETWRVRMRSDLWGPRAYEEVTSGDVDFTSLAAPVPMHRMIAADTAAAPGGRLIFNIRAEQMEDALAAMVEGHLRVSGKLQLCLDADCVWHVTPATRSSRIYVVPHDFSLAALELAWCKYVPGVEYAGAPSLPTGVQPLGTAGAVDNESSSDEPAFCAGGDLDARRGPILVRFDGDDAVNGSIGALGTVTFTYVRQDWRWRSGQPAMPGVATVSGAWDLKTRLARQPTIPTLCLVQGTLELGYTGDGPARQLRESFAGTISAQADWMQTSVGRWLVRGWTEQPGSRTTQLPQVCLRFKYPSGPVARGQSPRVKAIDVPLLVLESDLAPAESEHSRFRFEPTLVTALWRTERQEMLDATDPSQGSYLWLGSPDALPDRPTARVDLTRARLEVSRTADLLHVAFMFADLNLEIFKKHLWIRPISGSCRVLNHQTEDAGATPQSPQVADMRPTLVVEFPPQHVFEEAVFKPSVADFPEESLEDPRFTLELTRFSEKGQGQVEREGDQAIVYTEPGAFLRLLGKLTEPEDRVMIRQELSQRKIAREEQAGRPSRPFKTLAAGLARKITSGSNAPPSEQFTYIGPYGMDPDVSAIARDVMRVAHEERIEALFENVLERATELVQSRKLTPQQREQSKILQAIILFIRQLTDQQDRTLTGEELDGSPEAALRSEIIAGKLIPEYEFFREFYRERMTELLLLGRGAKTAKGDPVDESILLLSTAPSEIEYYSASNREWPEGRKNVLKQREEYVVEKYLVALKGADPIEPTMRARLSNPSRLAFRVNCGPQPIVTAGPRGKIARAGDAIEFKLSALTDWKRHELAVTPRAWAFTAFDEAGRPVPDAGIDPAADRQEGERQRKEETTVEEDVAMLRRLGIRAGQYVTAQERLADVEASLRRPSALETAIEIPARLILSPSQRATWTTPQPLTGLPVPLADAQSRNQRAADSGAAVPLWNASLTVDNPKPALRAVFSPDLRPGFVRRGIEYAASKRRGKTGDDEIFRTPFLSAPPRGPRAPWTLGVEEGDPGAMSLEKLLQATGTSPDAIKQLPQVACPRPIAPAAKESEGDDEKQPPEQLHPLVEYMHQRKLERAEYKRNGVFRSSLDAYDRHELVLLTSAWGLPVRGRREQNGQLVGVSTSSQVEPPNELRPIDIELGSALYRPRPLRVQELKLTSLGGTFRHDTDFVPPSAARHISYGPLYSSLSIERWQHWIVLGRDVFAEVVYKGFLFPIGHRASLIKQTERVFLRPSAVVDGERQSSVRAYLRQRMFIRIGQPDKAFPALGQPNLGRQFPASLVRMLTTVTPDLVDPTQDAGRPPQEEGAPVVAEPGGRLFAQTPGLVFWPRTARIAGAEVRFDALIDDSFVNLPLIFADNTAINDPDLLAKLVAYYNGLNALANVSTVYEPAQHLRSIDFTGQAHRYCNELKPGTATHKTLYWTLKASGGANAPSGAKPQPVEQSSIDWEGDNTRFDDPTLEAADQPPFYPALETAQIRLEQLERMTAQTVLVGIVKYDGHFVAKGLPTPPAVSTEVAATEAAAKENPLEIYFNFVNEVSYTMGAAGDRSGGLFRPESHLVAWSRQRGPVGGGREYDKSNSKLTSLASFYSESPGSGSAGNIETYQSYFSSPPKDGGSILDTKLLGVISIKDLLGFMKLKPVRDGLPDLREVVNYGIAGESDADEAIRAKVIAPLREAVAQVQAKWDALDEQLRKRSPDASLALTMSEVFPEVHGALRDFSRSLAQSSASASADSVELYSTLAEVYESGRRLVDALGRASANPIERVYVAVARRLQESLGKLQDVRKDIFETLSALVQPANMAAAIAEAVVNEAMGRARFLSVLSLIRDQAVIAEQVEDITKLLNDSLFRALDQGAAAAELTRFVEALRTRVMSIPPGDWPEGTSAALRDSLEPLFDAAQTLHDARRDVLQFAQRGASTARTVLLLLASPPDVTLAVEQVKSELLVPLQQNFEATRNEIAIVVEEELKDRAGCIRADDVLRLPSDLDRPANRPGLKAFVKTLFLDQTNLMADQTTVARALYDFISELETVTANALIGDVRLRQALIALGNEAVCSLIEVLQKAEVYRRKLDTFKTALDEFELAVARFNIVKEMFEARAELLRSVQKALTLVLGAPIEGPLKLGKVDEQLGTKVRAVVRKALTAQQRVLEGSRVWLGRWEAFGAAIGEADTAPLTFVNENLKRIEGALNRTEKLTTWTALLSERASLLPYLDHVRDALPGDSAIESFDRMATRAIRRLWDATLSLESKGTSKVAAAIKALIEPVKNLYGSMVKHRDNAYEQLKGAFAAARPMLLVPLDREKLLAAPDPTENELAKNNDQLYWDYKSLQQLFEDSEDDLVTERKNFQYITTFLRDWEQGRAAPLRIIDQARRFNVEDARARLLSLIDFSSVREEIDQRIRQLIPMSASLEYGFGSEFTGADENAIFQPQRGSALTVRCRTHVDLLTGKSNYSAVGELGPFDIQLIGSFRALRLMFDGARFESTGGPPRCDVYYRDFKLQDQLQFLNQLQSFFTPKQGSGFYLVPLTGGLGIEAGYSLNVGTISIGTVAFFNVSLNASARLPFDGRAATFVTSLSRRDSPFTISCAPYGGSGFFALESNGKGITGFEASFEYGGAAAFSYGPLNGQGRIMTGIYIRRQGKECEIGATFYAGGTASIWVFNFGASLYVCARQSGSNMVGTATFTFSFSMGIVDYDYQVKVSRKISWQGGGKGDQAASRELLPDERRLLFAERRARKKQRRSLMAAVPEMAETRVDTWCQGTDWARHKQYIDLGIAVDVEEFA